MNQIERNYRIYRAMNPSSVVINKNAMDAIEEYWDMICQTDRNTVNETETILEITRPRSNCSDLPLRSVIKTRIAYKLRLIKLLLVRPEKNPEPLHGCGSEDLKEIDGKEFSVTDLKGLIQELKLHKEVHLSYYEDDPLDMDLWIRVVS